MAAGDKILNTRYLKCPTSQVAGVVSAKINIAPTVKIDQGAASDPGPVGRLMTNNRVTVEAYAIHEAIMVASGVTFSGAAIAGAAYARVAPTTTCRINQGAAGSPGDAGAIVTDKMVAVEVYGNQYMPLMALLGATAADTEISVLDSDNAAGTVTVTNVYFCEQVAPIDIPEKDSGGKIAAFGIRGYVNFEANDTFATVISSSTGGAFALLALVGTASANAIIGTVGAGGAHEKITVKNVVWTECLSNIEASAKDAGGKLPAFGIRGYAIWGASDTLSTMIVAASDA